MFYYQNQDDLLLYSPPFLVIILIILLYSIPCAESKAFFTNSIHVGREKYSKDYTNSKTSTFSFTEELICNIYGVRACIKNYSCIISIMTLSPPIC